MKPKHGMRYRAEIKSDGVLYAKGYFSPEDRSIQWGLIIASLYELAISFEGIDYICWDEAILS